MTERQTDEAGRYVGQKATFAVGFLPLRVLGMELISIRFVHSEYLSPHW